MSASVGAGRVCIVYGLYEEMHMIVSYRMV